MTGDKRLVVTNQRALKETLTNESTACHYFEMSTLGNYLITVAIFIFILFEFEIIRIYLGHMMLRPPSMAMVWPVMKLASSLARNPMRAATSSAPPTLPRACVVLQCSRNLW